MQGIGARIVDWSWIVVLVANDEMLGFLRQPNLREKAIAIEIRRALAWVTLPRAHCWQTFPPPGNSLKRHFPQRQNKVLLYRGEYPGMIIKDGRLKQGNLSNAVCNY